MKMIRCLLVLGIFSYLLIGSSASAAVVTTDVDESTAIVVSADIEESILDDMASIAPVLEAVVQPSLKWYGVLHTASYAGLIAPGVGLGYGWASCDLLLGYVPQSVGGEDLWSLALKPGITLFGIETADWLIEFRAGSSFLYSFDDDMFLFQPSHLPDKYYGSTAFIIGHTLGVHLHSLDHTAYAEITALHHYLRMKAENWDTVDWRSIVSLGFGYRYQFR